MIRVWGINHSYALNSLILFSYVLYICSVLQHTDPEAACTLARTLCICFINVFILDRSFKPRYAKTLINYY